MGAAEYATMTSTHFDSTAEGTRTRMICGTDDLRIVPLDSGVYSIHLDTPTGHVRIGQVHSKGAHDTWIWQHRDGERSSPVIASLGDAVHALAGYHRRFKTEPDARPVRRLLFG